MHPALVTFFKEYQSLLKTTEDLYNTTQEKFVEIQQKIRSFGVTDANLNELFAVQHKLFQTGYLLMESHLRVNNLRANYSEDEQNIIDQYSETEKKVNCLIANIASYKQTMTNNSGLNV